MTIKVCGMKDPANIRAVAEALPERMGFIFFRDSPRYAGDLAPDVLKTLPGSIQKVGVFVNEDRFVILETVRKYGLDTVQLHGEEPPEVCHELQEEGVEVIKVFRIATQEDLERTTAYTAVCDRFLFDTRTPESYGGSGEKFDHDLLRGYTAERPYLLSGGLGPEDADRLPSFEGMEGVDINSRFETAPGIKDADLVRAFIQKLRA